MPGWGFHADLGQCNGLPATGSSDVLPIAEAKALLCYAKESDAVVVLYFAVNDRLTCIAFGHT